MAASCTDLYHEGILQQREEIAYQMLSCCVLCPRQCKANRLVGETGVCGTGSLVRIASFGPHFGEEQPLVGSHGSVPSLWQRSSFSKTGSFDQSFGVSGSVCFCQTCRLNKNWSVGCSKHYKFIKSDLIGSDFGMKRIRLRRIPVQLHRFIFLTSYPWAFVIKNKNLRNEIRYL